MRQDGNTAQIVWTWEQVAPNLGIWLKPLVSQESIIPAQLTTFSVKVPHIDIIHLL